MQKQELKEEQIQLEEAVFFSKVYGWMSASLVITGMIAWFIGSVTVVSITPSDNNFISLLLVLPNIIFPLYLLDIIEKISAKRAGIYLLLFAILNGFTLSTAFLIYTAVSIGSTFFAMAGAFGIMSIYGYYTKRDLTTERNLTTMGLIGVVIASIINFYNQNEISYWLTTFFGIGMFMFMIASNTQKIKEANMLGNSHTEDDKKEAILGALLLYLLFIDLFLKLLKVLGKRKNKA